MAEPITDLATAARFAPETPITAEPGSTLRELQTLSRKPREVLQEWAAIVARIDRNDQLTPIGRQARKGEAAPQFTERLDRVGTLLNRHREHLAALERELVRAGEEPDPSDVRTALQEQEVRQRVRELDLAGRQDFIDKAIDQRDTLAVRALLDAPPTLIDLPEPFLQLSRARWASKRDPQKAREATGVSRLIDRVQADLDVAVTAILRESGRQPDVVADVARTGEGLPRTA